MGQGETEMSTWGYVSSGLAISLGLFSFISSLLCIVVLKGSPTTTLRTATENFTLFMVVISVGVLVVACISCWKIYNSHKLYIDVAAGAVGAADRRTDQPVPVVNGFGPTLL